MKKSTRIVSLLSAIVCCIVLLWGDYETKAAAGTVTSYEKITWGISTGRYGVNGIHAYCAEYNKSWPPVGATIESISLSDNEILRKALYYGYNGPQNTLGIDARAHVLTAIAVSDANIGERETGASAKCDTFYWDIVNNPSEYPSPPSNFKAYIAVTSSTSQQDLAFYQMEKNGYAKAVKKSSQPEITDGNPCYSLSGAQYAIYCNASLAGNTKVGTLTTNEKGETNTVELTPGTYYAVEVKAPMGYALSTEVTKFTVTSEKTTVLQFSDKPQLNPIDILLEKVDAETNLSEPQGEASLQGAQFTVKYYAGMWEEGVDPNALGQVPIRNWVFETDENGRVYFKDNYKVSGNALYSALPLGTVTIQETKASEGYLINETVFVRQITAEGTTETVATYMRPIIAEQVLKVEVTKYQKETELPIPGTVFEVTKPDGCKELFTTDEGGRFIMQGLAYGKYELREISVMDGYILNQNVREFMVNEDSEGQTNIVIYNDPVPYDLIVHKTDHYGNCLSGAEFILYDDVECEQVSMRGITDETGILRMNGLIVGQKYYLKETHAPSGYEGELDVHEIYAHSTPVNNEFLFYIDGVEQEGVTGTAAKREGHIEVKNQVGYVLPKTGSSVPLIMSLAGVTLCSMGVCSMRKRKSNEKEKE